MVRLFIYLLLVSCYQDSKTLRPIDLYILIGDSNQNGAEFEPDSIPMEYRTQKSNVLIYFKPDRSSTDNGQWQLYSVRETKNERINRVPGYDVKEAGPYSFGTDQSFAEFLDKVDTTKKLIIKMAKGGSSLIEQPGLENDWSDDDLYSSFIKYFYLPAQEDIHDLGYRFNLKGIVIRLGTNDVPFWNESLFER